MSDRLYIAVALGLILAGGALVFTDLHDIWRSREFWRALHSGNPNQPLPAYWDSRYVMSPLTLWTPKIIGGSLIGLCGVGLLIARLRARRATRN